MYVPISPCTYGGGILCTGWYIRAHVSERASALVNEGERGLCAESKVCERDRRAASYAVGSRAFHKDHPVNPIIDAVVTRREGENRRLP